MTRLPRQGRVRAASPSPATPTERLDRRGRPLDSPLRNTSGVTVLTGARRRGTPFPASLLFAAATRVTSLLEIQIPFEAIVTRHAPPALLRPWRLLAARRRSGFTGAILSARVRHSSPRSRAFVRLHCSPLISIFLPGRRLPAPLRIRCVQWLQARRKKWRA